MASVITRYKTNTKTSVKKAKTRTHTPRLRNQQSVKNIKRIDSTKTHGWQVHVRRGGVLRTKLFSDRVYKGKRKALAEAKRYRDSLLAEMDHLAKHLWQLEREAKTNTGKLGASLTEYINRAGTKRTVITVTAREAVGRPVNRKFSVDKLGYDEALRRAVAWRDEVLASRAEREAKAEQRRLAAVAAAAQEAKA
jgi:hypothetical protein